MSTSRRSTAKVGKPGAMALGAKDDWNLTDWFENIYIRQAGVEAYDKLFSAEGDWADPSVQTDVDTMLEVINDKYVVGGIDAAVGRAWTDAIAQVFKPEPEAAVFYEGGFVGGIATGQTNRPSSSARPSTGSPSRPSATPRT